MEFSVAGIPVNVQRKKIKNLHLYVKPPKGEVLVTAPVRCPNYVIQNFLNEKEGWIVKNVERFRNTPVEPDPEYVTGETHPLWGELYTLQVTEGKRGSVSADPETRTIRLVARTDSTKEDREKQMIEFYRSELKERTDILLPQWEQYTGLKSSSWISRNMKSRWGTCNVKTRRITLNVQLAKHPVECLEYVILHELCHIRVPNHGPEFKALEDRYMPEWRQVRKVLNGRDPAQPLI